MKSRNNKLFQLLFLSNLLFSCATLKNDIFESFVLNGMVYNQSGIPVQNMIISIDNDIITKTDIRGRFSVELTQAGEHSISTEHQDFEKYSSIFVLNEKSDILYISVISYTELLDKSEEKMDNMEWDSAENYIKRALAIYPSRIEANYLMAVYQALPTRKDRNPESSIEILENMLESGHQLPYIFLFLADLYEYDLLRKEPAREYLRKYLEKRYDAAIIKRLENLNIFEPVPENNQYD